jgi:ribosomal protein S18 acetylase RimI-like enzyme
MAALPDIASGSLLDLRSVSANALTRLLDEEGAVWRKEFSWDFRPSAELVRKFVDLRALTGCAVMRGGQAVGYSYYVCEDGKGLIGDLYVSPSPHQMQDENTLLTAILDALWRTPGVDRIETQLMMLRQPLSRSVPYPRWFSSHPRRFYEVDLGRVAELPVSAKTSGNPMPPIVPWSEARQDEAAELIAHSYHGHIDSQINDQYRSTAGARRFLLNIIQYPGCGSFFAPASFVAIDRYTQKACGLCLTSLVSERTGHITQLCVAPEHRGSGLGRQLLRKSLLALAAHGALRTSLTVTSVNQDAIGLYERMGFRNQRDFAAYVWQAPRL